MTWPWQTSVSRQLAALTNAVNQLRQDFQTMSGTLSTDITALQQQVAQNTSVEQSAVTLISGLASQLAAAITAAQNAGATPDQLIALTSMQSSLNASGTTLAAAVAANTPAAPAPQAPAAAPAAPAPAAPAAS